MYRLFETVSNQNNTSVKYAEWDYIRRSYLQELTAVKAYYRSRVYSVKSNHFLARILNNLNIPMYYPADQYANIAITRAPFVLGGIGVTSSRDKGTLFNGIFYGPGVTEIIISDTDYFNPYQAEINWRDICAVKPLLHPKSDLGLLLPNGRPMSSGSGLAVISINLPLLAMQYRGFCLEQQAKTSESGSLLSVSHFIHMYVLPNMLDAQTDIVIMNRLMKLYYGAPMGKANFKHPFMVHDYSDKIDKVLTKVLHMLDDKAMMYTWLLKNIPMITSTDAQAALILPDVMPTMQVQWVIVLSRLSIINFIIDVGGDKCIHMNRTDLNTLRLMFIRLRGSHLLENILPKAMLYDTMLIINNILKK